MNQFAYLVDGPHQRKNNMETFNNLQHYIDKAKSRLREEGKTHWGPWSLNSDSEEPIHEKISKRQLKRERKIFKNHQNSLDTSQET